MLTWRWVVPGLLVVAFGGCQEPAQVIQAEPPGANLPRALPPSEKEPEALGEMAVKGRRNPAADAAKDAPSPDLVAAPPTAKGETRTTASGVKYETIEPGNGPEALPGKTVKVHYTGTLQDGTKFDSSRDSGKPFSFTIGVSQVIKGWHEGVAGMKVGEHRKLVIPPDAGYGASGTGPIPGNATLNFDIELLGIE